MRIYTFAKVAARNFPTMSDINNPYIFSQDVRHVINVSENEHPEHITKRLQEKGISAVHIPLKEDVGGMSAERICEAVKLLLKYDRNDERTIVHCDFGNNRSRTVIEAFYYAKFGEHFRDEYKGAFNHLICNCNRTFIINAEELMSNISKLGRL